MAYPYSSASAPATKYTAELVFLDLLKDDVFVSVSAPAKKCTAELVFLDLQKMIFVSLASL